MTSSPITNLRSLRAHPAAATGYAKTVGTFGAGLIVARFKVKFTTLPDANTFLLNLAQQGNVGPLFNQSDSKIYAATSITGESGATGVSVTTGVEYLIDVRIDTSISPRTVDVTVNGVACGQVSTVRAANTTATEVHLGFPNTCTADALFDDVLVSITGADYPLGNGKVLGFVPNADGTHTSTSTNIVEGTIATPVGTAITSATTDAFNWVNARPILGGATDNTRLINQQTASSAQYVEVDFEPTTEVNPPRAVEVVTADREASTATCNFITKLNDNGTESDIVNRGTVAGSTSDRYATKQFATMVGGGAWTLARFNALKARFGYSSDATPDVYWRGIMIEAEFPTSLNASAFGRPDGQSGQRLMNQLLAT